MIRNLIYNELQRYRLADSNDITFNKHSQQLFQRLLNRGYKTTKIIKHFATTHDRSKLIESITTMTQLEHQQTQRPWIITLERPAN